MMMAAMYKLQMRYLPNFHIYKIKVMYINIPFEYKGIACTDHRDIAVTDK